MWATVVRGRLPEKAGHKLAFRGKEKENKESKIIVEREAMGVGWTEQPKSPYALLLMIQSSPWPGF